MTKKDDKYTFSVDDYQKRIRETEAPYSPANSNSQNGNSNANLSTNDYYKMAREQEYSKLVDKEIQLENAKANATKYANAQINAQGFGGTGYGASQSSGIANSYINRWHELQNEHNQNIQYLSEQERQENVANANQRFESITTMLSQASSTEQMNSLLQDYGYGKINEETGEFVFGVEELDENGKPTGKYVKPEGMSDDDWYQMKYYYNLQKNDLDIGSYNSLEALRKATYVNSAGAVNGENIGKMFGRETDRLWHEADIGTYKNGDTIKITNSVGEVIYMQRTANGFKMVNAETYNNSNGQYEICYSSSTNTTITHNKVK